MATIASLDIALGANSANLRRDLNQAGRSTREFADRTEQQARRAANACKVLSVAATAVAGSLALMVNRAASNAQEIIRLSRNANVGTSEFQALAFASKTVGFEQEKLGDVLKDVNDKIGDFISTGAGPMVDFFDNIGPKVGVTIDDFRELSGPAALGLFISSLQEAGLSQQEMVFYMESLASDATDLIPLFANNGAQLASLTARYDDLNIALSETELSALAQADMSLDMVKAAVDGLSDRLGAALAPAVVAVSEAFLGLLGQAQRLATIAGTAAVAFGTYYAGAMIIAAAKTMTLVGALTTLRAALIRTGIGALIVLAGELIYRFNLMKAATGWIQEFTGWVAEAAKWLREKLAQALGFVAEYIQVVIGFWSRLLAGVVSLFTLDFAGFGRNMKDAFKLVIDFFEEKFGDSLQRLGRNLKAQFGYALQSVAYAFTSTLESGINLVLEKLHGALDMIPGLDMGPFQGINIGGNAPVRPDWERAPLTVPNSPLAGPGGMPIGTPTTTDATLTALNDTLTELDSTVTNLGTPSGSGRGGTSPAANPAIDEAAVSVSTSFMDSLKTQFSSALKTGDWKEFGFGVLDTFTSGIIDQISGGLMDSLFGNTFDNIFENFGKSISDSLGKIFSGLGGSGGGGGLFGAFAGLFMATGGVVPHTPYSKIGRDSVPAMLTPGELVVPVGEVGNYMNSGSGQIVNNINITGDISRQTKKEIYSMLPEISKGVNSYNHETGSK